LQDFSNVQFFPLINYPALQLSGEVQFVNGTRSVLCFDTHFVLWGLTFMFVSDLLRRIGFPLLHQLQTKDEKFRIQFFKLWYRLESIPMFRNSVKHRMNKQFDKKIKSEPPHVPLPPSPASSSSSPAPFADIPSPNLALEFAKSSSLDMNKFAQTTSENSQQLQSANVSGRLFASSSSPSPLIISNL